MTARNSHEFTPKSAERLLDGQGGAEPLARLLNAAAAPGRAHEFRGEDAAVAAFEYHYARDPAAARRAAARSPGGRLPIARILALAAGLCGGGAVALAAATGAFSGSPAPSPSAARVSPGASSVFTPRPHATGGPVRAQARGPVVPPRGSSPGAPGPAALCRDLAAQAGQAQAGLEQALASSAVPGLLGGARYAPLTAAAGGTLGVPDYCALLLRLPALPRPAAITEIPASVLATALTGLPAGTLSAILPRLPAPALSRVLDELPVPTVSKILTGLPAGPLGQVLGKLPLSDASAVLGRLPAATASRIQAKLPRKLPGSKAGLPSPLPSRLPVG